jgi:hypothetical protein
VLEEWFSDIRIANTVAETVITVQRRPLLAGGRTPPPVEVRLDRRGWARASRASGRTQRRQAEWTDEEILAALREWAARHGRSPSSYEWIAGSPDRPASLCVRRRFGSWRRALKRAGLKPGPRRLPYWSDADILRALRIWAKRHGRAPTAKDWTRAASHHPCTRCVWEHFGSFRAALVAAGLGRQPDR